MRILLALSLALPLLVILLLIGSRRRSLAQTLVPAVSLPPLLLAVFPAVELELPWLLLGTHLGVDETGRPLLLLAGLVWTAAGFYARGYLAEDRDNVRFHVFYLLSYTGNLGVILALDAASFYLFFALLSFAAYGLIVHDGGEVSRRAGRVYLVMAVLGEALLITALFLLAMPLGNPQLRELGPTLAVHPSRDLIIGLLLASFGIKMGIVPLHLWMPLAYAYAPIPASMVLSGIIVKAGLLGWLRFLPAGEVALPGWGALCLTVGMISAFYGVLASLPQQRPKIVLGYSSVSQMGLMLALFGVGLAAPAAWPSILVALLVFSLHHGLAKGALFLGVAVAAKGNAWSGWGLLLPGLALAGAPLTSGALAKLLFKDLSDLAPGVWAHWLPWLLSLSSIATAALIARFLYLIWPRGDRESVPGWLWAPWLGLLAAVLLLPGGWAMSRVPEAVVKALAPASWWGNFWPVLVAAGLAAMAWELWRLTGFRLRLPEGDILYFVSPRTWRLRWVVKPTEAGWRLDPGRLDRAQVLLRDGESLLRSWAVAGSAFLLLAAGLVVLLWIG